MQLFVCVCDMRCRLQTWPVTGMMGRKGQGRRTMVGGCCCCGMKTMFVFVMADVIERSLLAAFTFTHCVSGIDEDTWADQTFLQVAALLDAQVPQLIYLSCMPFAIFNHASAAC